MPCFLFISLGIKLLITTIKPDSTTYYSSDQGIPVCLFFKYISYTCIIPIIFHWFFCYSHSHSIDIQHNKYRGELWLQRNFCLLSLLELYTVNCNLLTWQTICLHGHWNCDTWAIFLNIIWWVFWSMLFISALYANNTQSVSLTWYVF